MTKDGVVAQGTPSKFEYLLNAVERAAMQLMPSQHGYAGHRAKALDYVTKLEAEVAALSAQVAELEKKLFYTEREKYELDENAAYRAKDYAQCFKRAETLAAQVVELQKALSQRRDL